MLLYIFLLIIFFSELAKLVFVTYKNLQELLMPQQDRASLEAAEEDSNRVNPKFREPNRQEPKTESNGEQGKERKNVTKIVNSNIISASVNGHKNKIVPVPEPITYTLEHKTVSLTY